MIENIKILFLMFICVNFVKAQNEFLGPIGFNSSLIKHQDTYKSDFVYHNIVITADTLSLPFVDDFSTNTLRSYDFTTRYVYDTVVYATGSCIDLAFDAIEGSFNITQTFNYFFDVANQRVDSVPFNAITINYYNNNVNCFSTTSSTATFFPRPFSFTFDSTTGAKLDSTPLVADTIISYATIYFAHLDSNTNWTDNYAYYNTTFPINPPTIGVATLDGLNEFGRPYNNASPNLYGNADVLTSKPINLSGLHNDSALFISFFVQAKGMGDLPNSQDSLVLEFKNEFENQWVKVWGITVDNVISNEFKQFYVAVRDTNLVTGPRYFYENFQFRFRNKASISGNNDHWHIDYIRLDKNRAQIELDTVIRDVAFMYDFPNILETYSILPWSQFQAGADSFANEIKIPIRDNGQVNGVSAGAFPIDVLITDSLDADTIFQLNGVNFNPTSEIKDQVFTPISNFVKPNFQEDSICINSRMFIEPTARNAIQINDTIFNQICLGKVMAYDDGSAERAYGVSGNPNELKKFAYKFEVAHPDTLAAIQIHFSYIDENVEDLIFNLYAWDSIQVDVPLSYDNVIGVIENAKPIYFDKLNGFATFAFDTPILVKDKFYIGWAQTESRNLQVGFDKNSIKGKNNIFVYTTSTWRASTITENGSPMIRAVLDADFQFNPSTSIKETLKKGKFINVYPNPTNNLFIVDISKGVGAYQINVYDYTGKLIESKINENQFDLIHHASGIYFIQTLIGNELFYSKVMKK